MSLQDQSSTGRKPKHYEITLTEKIGMVGNPPLRLVPSPQEKEKTVGEK